MVLRVHPGLPLLALGRLLDDGEAQAVMARLCAEVPWSDGSNVAAGRRFSLPRRQAWFADPGVDYRYAANLLNSHPWTPLLQALKSRVENASGHRFNAVLANLYPDGQASVGWHADDEPGLGPTPVIASVNLGAERRFSLRAQGFSSVCTSELNAPQASPPREYEYEPSDSLVSVKSCRVWANRPSTIL